MILVRDGTSPAPEGGDPTRWKEPPRQRDVHQSLAAESQSRQAAFDARLDESSFREKIMGGPLATVKTALRAYVDKVRGAIERLIAEDYSFTSPIDNDLDRQSYFARCWPNSEVLVEMTLVAGGEAERPHGSSTRRQRCGSAFATPSCTPYALAGSSGRRSTSAGICPSCPARRLRRE